MHPYPVNPNVSAVDEAPPDPRCYPPIRRMESLLRDLITLRDRPAEAIRARSLWETDLMAAGLRAPFVGHVVAVPRGLAEGQRATDDELELTRWEHRWVDESIYSPHPQLGRLFHGREPPDEAFLDERLARWDAWLAASPDRHVERNRSARLFIEKQRRERWDHLLGVLDFPERPLFTVATPNFVETHSTYVHAVAWLESGSRMLTINGVSSTGKTTAIMGLLWHDMGLKRWVDTGHPMIGAIRYVRSTDLLRMAHEAGRKDAPRPEKEIEQAKVLVIDEVGAESVWADRVAAYYDRLIDRRYCDLDSYTVLLSNSDASRLLDLLGERTMRRITEEPGRMITAEEFIAPGQQTLGVQR